MGKVPKLGRAGYRWMLLAVLVAGAGALRFYHIDEPGFTEGADCMYTETAYTMLLLGQWSWHNPGLLFAGVEKTQGLVQYFSAHHVVPQMPYSCKPVWDFMNVAAVAVGGYNDVVSAGLSALMGTLSVLAIFWLGKALYGERVGLGAAALLAVAGGGLVFSRYGQSHMASLLFLMLGCGFYLRSLSRPLSWRSMAPSSLLFGLALATHPNLLPNVGLFALYEVFLLIRHEMPGRSFVRRALVMGGTIATVVMLLDLPFEVVKFLFGGFFDAMAPYMVWPFMTYLEQLPHHFGLVVATESATGLRDSLYAYLVEPWAWEGVMLPGLVIVSVVWSSRNLGKARLPDLIVYSQFLIPLACWIYSEHGAVYRFAAGILPAGLVIAAGRLDRIAIFVAHRLRFRVDPVMALLVALVVLYTFQNSRVIYQARSAYKEAAQWLQLRGEDRLMVSHPRSWRFYGIEPVPLGREGLDQVRYMAFYPRYTSPEERQLRAVLASQEPTLRVADLRPGKLLEVQFMERSLALKLLVKLPGIGPYAAQTRQTVLERNRLRCLEVYEIGGIRHELAAVL